VRCVERGSRLVNASNDRVVVQMPRGNLEGFNPRLLMLYRVKHLIMTDSYGKAYEILRTHRMDLNLLFDINVEGFMQKTDLVVEQVGKEDFLNLFLTTITDDFNSSLEYILTPDEINKNKDILLKQTSLTNTTKVQFICDLLIKSMRKLDEDKYILSIMTGHIKKNELDIVLNYVIQTRNEEVSSKNVKVPPHLNPETMKKFKPAKKVSFK
jgi:elongator complex protein 1